MDNDGSKRALGVQSSPIAANSAILILTFGSNLMLGFVGNYIAARHLGLEDFGRLSLVLAVAGAIGLARAGVATTVMKLSATQAYDDVTLVRTGILLQSVIGASLALILVPAILYIDGSSQLLLPCLLVASAFMAQSVYEMPAALFAGKDRMIWQFTNTATLTLTVLIGWFLFTAIDIHMAAWPTAMFIAASVVAISSWASLRRPVSRHTPPVGAVANILRPAAALCGIAFLLQIHWNADIVIVRVMSTPTDLGLFSAGTRLLPGFRTVAAVLTTATAPTLFRVINDGAALRPLVNSSIRQLGLIGCVLTLVIFGSADAITGAMFPAEFAQSVTVLEVVSLGIVPLLLQWIFLNVLWIRGRWWTLTGCYVIAIAFQILCQYFVVPRFGAVGAAWVLVLFESLLAATMAVATQLLIGNATGRGVTAAIVTAGATATVAVVGWQFGISQGASVVAIVVLFTTARATGALHDADLQLLRGMAHHFSGRVLRNPSDPPLP